MKLHYSQMIEKFSQNFGVTKEIIEDTFNKPDKTDIIGGAYISLKFYPGFLILITFRMHGNDVNFENAYKIVPSMISIDVDKARAVDILENFMNGFGMEVEVPSLGKKKFFKDEQQRVFFQGILDIEKYTAAALQK